MDGRKFFLNANKGLFSEKAKPGEPVNRFGEVTGHLVNITFKQTDYGEAMRLHVVNELNFYVLSMFVNSRPANAFFMLVKSLILDHEMTFIMKEWEGKDYFTIWQFGGPVLWYYTSENIHELPPDPSHRKAYLKEMVINEIIPVLQKKLNPFPHHLLYKPARKGLHGGYFDGFKSPANVVSPLRSEGSKHYE